jgi:hypothetical protein
VYCPTLPLAGRERIMTQPGGYLVQVHPGELGISAHHHLGQYAEAITCCQQALGIARELGYGEAAALSHLGDTHHATADLVAARAI